MLRPQETNLNLFEAVQPSSTEPNTDNRRIAKSSPPPPHTPTSAVPDSLLQSFPPDILAARTERVRLLLEQCRRVIGEPYFEKNGFILYNCECEAALSRLAGDGFMAALTVTSPPYNIGKTYETVTDVENYVSWCVNWIKSIHTITANDGAFWLNLGYLPIPAKGCAIPIPYLLWDKSPFFLIQEVVWNYGAGVSTKYSFSPRNEKWLFFVANEDKYTFNLDEVRDPDVKYPNQKKNGKFRCNPLGKNPSDVWQFPKVTTGTGRSSKERTSHPAQFPLGIVERIIRVSSNPCDVILDPFSGSASTGIAAIGLGRLYLGFEKSDEYCRISVERFERFEKLREQTAMQVSLPHNEEAAVLPFG